MFDHKSLTDEEVIWFEYSWLISQVLLLSIWNGNFKLSLESTSFLFPYYSPSLSRSLTSVSILCPHHVCSPVTITSIPLQSSHHFLCIWTEWFTSYSSSIHQECPDSGRHVSLTLNNPSHGWMVDSYKRSYEFVLIISFLPPLHLQSPQLLSPTPTEVMWCMMCHCGFQTPSICALMCVRVCFRGVNKLTKSCLVQRRNVQYQSMQLMFLTFYQNPPSVIFFQPSNI